MNNVAPVPKQAPIYINPDDMKIIAPVFATFDQIYTVVRGWCEQNEISEEDFPFNAEEGDEAIEISFKDGWDMVWYHPKPAMNRNIIAPDTKLILP